MNYDLTTGSNDYTLGKQSNDFGMTSGSCSFKLDAVNPLTPPVVINFRITEVDDFRTTEDDNFRILE